jgi:hypothetical protein
LWYKTTLAREGHNMVATTHMVLGGRIKVLRHTQDLRPLARAVLQASKDRPEIGAFRVRVRFRGLKKTVRRVGKSKLLKKVARSVHKVSKKVGDIATSKAFRGVLAGASAVLAATGVGAPAAAALAGATAALSVAAAYKNNAQKIRKAARKVKAFRKLDSKVKGFLGDKSKSKTARRRMARDPRILRARKSAKSAASFIRKMRSPQGKAYRAKLKARSAKAKAGFRKLAIAARYSKSATRRDEARKMARIVKIAAQTRAKVKGAAERSADGLPGIFITKDGRITRGRFSRTLTQKGTAGALYQSPEKPFQRGSFVVKDTPQARVSAAKENIRRVARHYKATKSAAVREGKRDRKKAAVAIVRARRSRMPTSKQRILARTLKNRLRFRDKARSHSVARAKVNVNKAVKTGKQVVKFARAAKGAWTSVSSMFRKR